MKKICFGDCHGYRRQRAKLMGFPDDRIDDLKTAVAEACMNAIEHGNLLDDSLSIGVILSAKEDSLDVKVVDGIRLTPHFQKIFTTVGIAKYARLYTDESSAKAAV